VIHKLELARRTLQASGGEQRSALPSPQTPTSRWRPAKKIPNVTPAADGGNPPVKNRHSSLRNKCNRNEVALTDNPPHEYPLRLEVGCVFALLTRRLK
jgi:hypothetical protein